MLTDSSNFTKHLILNLNRDTHDSVITYIYISRVCSDKITSLKKILRG